MGQSVGSCSGLHGGWKVWRSLSDRAHIVLLAAEGLNNVQIVNTLGINNLTARKRRSWQRSGSTGRTKPRNGAGPG